MAYVYLPQGSSWKDNEPKVALERIAGYDYTILREEDNSNRWYIFINATLVRSGYAQVSTYPPNVKYANYFRKLEREARKAKSGLWSDSTLAKIENYYVASKNSQVFHRPECPYASKIASYNRVKYNTREEAVKSGKRACSKCKP